MILLGLMAAVVSAAVLAPLARVRLRLRGARDAALALHRRQLAELETDASLGLVLPSDRDAARLEIERRILAADRLADRPDAPRPGSPGHAKLRWAGAAILIGAVGLYLAGGHPGFDAQPLAERLRARAPVAARDAALIASLKAAIARLDPHSAQARRGNALLGDAAAETGDWKTASEAFRASLAAGFDAETAYKAAFAGARAHGFVDPSDRALFERALAAGPPDAPWRLDAEASLAASEPH